MGRSGADVDALLARAGGQRSKPPGRTPRLRRERDDLDGCGHSDTHAATFAFLSKIF
jgi:hypothetical protein